jgi:predicted XRE-type DNA-binding protein
MSTDDFEIVRGTGNVFQDFGYLDADLRQAKCLLAVEIAKILDDRNWTTRRAEQATGINHADFARIRNANIGRFTLDRLMTVLSKLGQHVELAVTITPQPSAALTGEGHLGIELQML